MSTHPQEKHGYGLDTQLKACRALAERERLSIVDEIQDVDSGADWDLPGLHRLLDLAERGAIGTAVIYDPDRLSRSLSKYVWLDTKLTEAGVRANYVTVGAATTDDEKAFHEIKAVFAQLDYKRIIRRMAEGKRDKVARGYCAGVGVAPYGYRYGYDERGRQSSLEIDEERAPIVRRIFRDAARLSLGRICRGLNEDGVPTMHPERASAGWVPATVMGILAHPVYVGRHPYGRRSGKRRTPVRDESRWLFSSVPAIITQQEWEAAQGGLARRRVTRSARSPRTEALYPLRSMLTCSHCGGPLQTNINSGVRYYSCLRNESRWASDHGVGRCGLPAVPAEGLERVAWEEVVAALLDPDRLRAGLAAAQAQYADENGRRAEQIAAIERELAKLRARLSRILEEQLDAPAGSEVARVFREKARQIEVQIEHIEADLAALVAAPHSGLSPEQAQSLAQFAAEVRAGIDAASNVDRRRIFDLLQLQGRVRLDSENGMRLARKNRFSVQWDAVIRLRNRDREFTNIQTVWIGPAKAAAPTTPLKQAAAE